MKTTISKTIMFIALSLFTFNSFAQNGKCSASQVPSKFKDIVNYMNSDIDLGYYVEITSTNPARGDRGTHYYTAWARSYFMRLNSDCTINIGKSNVLFSDRDTFKGKQDQVSYILDLKNDSFQATLHSWGNSKVTFKNLKRTRNTIYHIKPNGETVILNLKKGNFRIH